MKRSIGLAVLSMLAGAAPAVAALKAVGPPITPHGFPAFYTDNNNLSLELCLPPPAGKANADFCFFDPVDPAFPELQVGGESFWWMAEATLDLGNFPRPGRPDQTRPARALVVLALEAAFSAEVAVNGSQMTFGRVRIRVDTPIAGTYTVRHPYGTETFTIAAADVEAGINVTRDIGGIAIFNPAAGYAGALASDLGPFLTWDTFNPNPALTDPLLKDPLDPTAQYVGKNGVPHAIKGGPNGNVFSVTGPAPIGLKTTNQFDVLGKVFVPPTPPATLPEVPADFFPTPPPPTLAAVGPVNRTAPIELGPPGTVALIPPSDPPVVPPVQPPEVVAGPTAFSNTFPVGFPQWFEDTNGVRLTLCPPFEPKCISAPPEPTPVSQAIRAGEEAFWWTGESFINDRTADIPAGTVPDGLDGTLVMALEAAFTGGAPANGEQMGFSRIRVRVDVPAAGTYTITHPYGQEVFENVDPEVGINMTRDIMMTSPTDPDAAFAGALFGDVGPFLTWDTFNADPALTDPLLKRQVDPANPASPTVRYVGDPTVEHAVTGSPNNTNFFRIQGPGIDVQTNLFAVSGKIFAAETFGGETGTDPATGQPRGFGGTPTTPGAPDVNIPVTPPGTNPDASPIGGGGAGIGGGGGGGGCFVDAAAPAGGRLFGWFLALVGLGVLVWVPGQRRRPSE